jgi:hypothetical protein
MGTAIGAAMIGCCSGVPIARGAPSTAGATVVVPHGEPLWNQLRTRPHTQHPLVEAASAATANRIVSFLMIGSPRQAHCSGCAK